MFIGVTIINHGVEVIRVKFRNDMKIYIGNNVYIYNYEIKIEIQNAMQWYEGRKWK